jgi:hypothetical protein
LGAGASYKPTAGGFSYHWRRQRFFAYGGQYFDTDMKPLINSAAGVRALDEMVRTMLYYPRGVLLFEAEEPKILVVKGEVPMLYSWTSAGKRVGNPAESVIVGKAGFGLVLGAEIDGKIIHRPAITPGRTMGVSIHSQKKDATMKVLELISHPDVSLKIVMDPKTIMDPWRVSHLRSEKFRKAFPGADEYLDAVEKSFPYLVPDPIIPGSNEHTRKLSFAITEALSARRPRRRLTPPLRSGTRSRSVAGWTSSADSGRRRWPSPTFALLGHGGPFLRPEVASSYIVEESAGIQRGSSNVLTALRCIGESSGGIMTVGRRP